MDSRARSLIYKAVCKIADLLEFYLSHSSYATDADRWITIGAGKNDWNESTGRHVKIDEHGNIVGGSVPKSAQGKPINSWWKSNGTANSKASQAGSGHEAAPPQPAKGSPAEAPKAMPEKLSYKEAREKIASGELATAINPLNDNREDVVAVKRYAVRPVTEGSEKQIKWANSIKRDLAVKAFTESNNAMQWSKDSDKGSPKYEKQVSDAYYAIIKGISDEKSAREIIDNRDMDYRGMIKKYYFPTLTEEQRKQLV